MPILGIMASQISGHLAVPNNFESIATTTLSSAAATITFSSIPATYKHLQIRAISRSSRAIVAGNIVILRFNADSTAANYYSTHNLAGDGSTAYSQSIADVGENGIWAGISKGDSTGANIFGTFVTDILDYTNTNKYKVTRSLQGMDNNSTDGLILLVSGLWLSTTAITSITLVDNTSNNFMQYSSFALYGIK
jgi:hypothetical protein